MSDTVEEKKLRKFIGGYLLDNHNKAKLENRNVIKEEKKLRSVIRKLLTEKESVVPGASTGINELESVLVSILPAIESDYKKLTSKLEQRKSYRAHIIRAAIDVLLAADASFAADQETESLNGPETVPQSVKNSLPPEAISSLKEQEQKDKIDINISDNSVSDEKKLIDVDAGDNPDDPTKTNEEPEEEAFTIPGQDLTGRNIALRTWNKRGIGTTIKNGYKLLENPHDRKIFFDYLLTNLKLYFDRFEKDLQGTVKEPTTDAYEKIKQSGESYSGGQPTIAEGKKRKRLVESKKLSDQIISHLLRFK